MEALLVIAYVLFLAFIAGASDGLKQIMLVSVWGLMALSVLYALGTGLYRLIA